MAQIEQRKGEIYDDKLRIDVFVSLILWFCRLIVTCDRGVMKKGLVKEIEFIGW